MSPTALNGPELPSTSGVTKRIVIFLHGLGADGNDLLSLAPMLELPDTHFMSPNAPFACDMAPYGYQWFSLQDRNPARILPEIRTAEPILNAYIDAALTRTNLKPRDVALVGFSQGSMMSLHTAPRRAEPIAGVVGISGALFGAERLTSELKSRPPVCLIHGTHDEVVPFVAMEAAATTLRNENVNVEAHARPRLGHGIDEEGIDITAAFLRRVFAI
jgi:phospholipase/carboxylesterase